MNKNNELFRRIYNHKMIDKIDKKIKLLGSNNNIDAIEFINLRILFSILFFLIVLFISKLGYIIAPIFTIIFYYLFGYIGLDVKINERRRKLEGEAIHFFEVLSLSLETDRNLEEAILVTISNVYGELSIEFENAMKEIQFGKSLSEALNDMEKYIPSDTINNMILSLTQASRYGSSIVNNLYDQIEYMRDKRRMEVKAAISKVPIKISIISVLFFVPLILIIILAPVILEFIG